MKEEEEKELERKSGKSCRSQSKVLWRFLWRLHSSSKIFSTIISLQKSLILNVLPELSLLKVREMVQLIFEVKQIIRS